MNAGDFPIDENFREYVRLLLELHRLFVDGEEETPDSEALRERMDVAWEKLDAAQAQGVGGLAADLNWLRRGPAPGGGSLERPIQDDLLRLNFAIQAGDWHQVLKHLRRMGPLLQDSALSYLRGDAWRHLGQYAVASRFFEHARALEPKNPEFASASSDCLAQIEPALGGSLTFARSPGD